MDAGAGIGSTFPERALEPLAEWIIRQRWYGGTGRAPRLRLLGSFGVPTGDPEVSAHSLLVMDEAPEAPVLYQVPVSLRRPPVDAAQHRIGALEDGTLMFDGPHDPVVARALLRLVLGTTRAQAAGVEVVGRPAVTDAAGRVDPDALDAHVLTGEQSNTSIIFEPRVAGTARPVICKVYRRLHHGENPDVRLPTALAEAGSPHVPASVGALTGTWADVGRASGRATGHLAFAQEFLPGVEDAWRVALRAAADGRSFDGPARELGVATADVHASLARAFGTRPAARERDLPAVEAWHRRLATAVREVPSLAPQRSAIEAVYARAEHATWPPMQRIHGDLHLGQAVAAPGRAWVLLDFEGEPLRPMQERTGDDLALRDVAGMLRSFDYVAGSTARARAAAGSAAPEAGPGDDPDADLRDWARVARRAFLDGYAEVAGEDPRSHGDLLAALELDKAVYEAIYETRTRPDWVGIPLTAIDRLLAGAEAAADAAP
ncbi:maltokinase N-terminal cap-like domain-containing protein [Agromyces sp. SYSU T00194]|uniref:maltokinase N-terminal cap-like domain-containing protein n=1 Tax=Agromyces chitinivorans TaxID=3158560 RepID=UPI003394A938